MSHRWRSAAWAASAVVILGILGGCAGQRGGEELLVDVQTADALGCRIGWQTPLALPDDASIQSITPLGEMLVVVESNGMVDALNRDNGQVRWRQQVGDQLTKLTRPLSYQGDVVICSALYANVLQADQGNLVQRFELRHNANTQPLLYQGTLIFGSPQGIVFGQAVRDGLLMWRYKMTSAIEADMILEQGFVGVADTTGNVAAVNARTGNLVWRRYQPPWSACSNDLVNASGIMLVACSDQKLYAFERNGGGLNWQYLTQHPLTASPTIVNERVLQPTRERGLVCLDLLTGEELWRSQELRGRPFARRGTELLFEEPTPTGLSIHYADIDTGQLVRTTRLPGVRRILEDEQRAWYLADAAGNIMQLLPR